MGQSQNIASAQDRFLIRSTLNGAGDQFSLQNLNTVPLPDGAMAFVKDQAALFELDKSSALPAQTDQVIIPGSGPGRWIRFATSELAGGGVALASTSTNTYAVDGNYGQATSAFFEIDGGADDHPNWALTALGGILTYTGPTRPFMVTLSADVQVGNADAARQVSGAVSFDNDITGALGPGVNRFTTTIPLGDAGLPFSYSAARRVVLATGDTLRPKFATPAASVALAVEQTMLVIPA